MFISQEKKTNTGHALSSTHGCKAGKGSWPTSGKFLQKKRGKNIPYLEGIRGGEVPRALTKKIDPG
jgi:hypothetical protein